MAVAPKIAVAGAATAVVYGSLVRPRLVRWGATDEEINGPFPGAELVPDGERSGAMAVTIDAPPEQVWPWLVQMGWDRGGWYSWDHLDNAGRPSAWEVHPEWQDIRPGDYLKYWAPGAGPMNAYAVARIEPNRFLGLHGLSDLRGRTLDPEQPRPSAYLEGLWGFQLNELPGGRTRLVVSGYQAGRPRWLGRVVYFWIFPPVVWIMQARMLAVLKRNIENAARANGPNTATDVATRRNDDRPSSAAVTRRGGLHRVRPGRIPIRDTSLYVDVVGQGPPLVLMHGGPSADLWTMQSLRQCADRFTLVFYDHRCNGRSVGAPVSSMTWENLTADADALRERLGFERWAVLGHSFGGQVALEYALRYPDRVSHLVLLGTGADSHWQRQNAPEVLRERGYGRKKVELTRRWFTGEFNPREYFPIFAQIGGTYFYRSGLGVLAHELKIGAWRSRPRAEPLIFAGRHLMRDWTVADRLGEITAPTLVVAGRDDFVFPPQSQRELAAGIPHARLRIIDRAGHNPHDEQTAEVVQALEDFLGADAAPG
ncbi:alpha/beta fold hydrolase [Rhodococcus sp. 14C212]|uniref:alpha/beta fold hydrolase n=1 Tax=Rhodococcus sp. 14C212 TaxID=2711209 RepID=UPI0013EB1036|nr:alpha/beta fold hydrolase [Rhodococcus sp. 14C212]NGP06381.1 alpha/beta fold hydrolase [Rhodococcus sp. 14C212]